MRALALKAALLLASNLSPAHAAGETVLGVTADDVAICKQLGDVGLQLAERKAQGVSKEDMLRGVQGAGMNPTVAQSVVTVLYAFEAADPQVYNKALTAFCIQDKLRPFSTTAD